VAVYFVSSAARAGSSKEGEGQGYLIRLPGQVFEGENAEQEIATVTKVRRGLSSKEPGPAYLASIKALNAHWSTDSAYILKFT